MVSLWENKPPHLVCNFITQFPEDIACFYLRFWSSSFKNRNVSYINCNLIENNVQQTPEHMSQKHELIVHSVLLKHGCKGHF